MSIVNTVLPNGVRILTCAMPGRRSAALGFWIRGGVRGEGARQSGYAHLLEHLLFRRHRAEYAALGGDINAMTSRECSVLHGLVPAYAIPRLAALFADTLAQPVIDAEGLENERRAILREMAEYRDNVWSSEADYVLERVWSRHAMARSILGEAAAIRAAGTRELAAYATDAIGGATILVSAAGAVDHGRLVEACARLSKLPASAPCHPREGGDPANSSAGPPRFKPCSHHEAVPIPASRLLWVLPMPSGENEVIALALAERLAAGGIDGVLQRTLRERLGLVYGVHSELERYSDCGLWWLRLSCSPHDAPACRHAVEDCFRALCASNADAADFERARTGLRAQWLIEDDDPSMMMQRIALESEAAFEPDARQSVLQTLTPTDVRSAIARAWEQRAIFSWGPPAARS